jgi:ankyrin repeat protein
MTPEVKKILEKVKDTSDFGYVEFKDINDSNELGDNALHCVAVWGDCEAAKVLIEAGIDINKQGEHGYTPLHEACSFGHRELVEILLNAGADPFARTEGDIPFTTARISGHNDICELLKMHMDKIKSSFKKTNHEMHIQHIENAITLLEKDIEEKCKK